MNNSLQIKTFPKKQSACHCINMRRASKALTQFYNDLLEPSELTCSQYALLNTIEKRNPVTMNELAARTRLERTTLIRNLKPLQANALISTVQGKDERRKLVEITGKGSETLNEARIHWKNAQQLLDSLIPADDLATFLKVLNKIESLVP